MSTEPDDVLIGAGIASSANSLRSEFRVAVKSATRIRDDLMSRGIRGGLALSAIPAVDVRLCFRRFSSVLALHFSPQLARHWPRFGLIWMVSWSFSKSNLIHDEAPLHPFQPLESPDDGDVYAACG